MKDVLSYVIIIVAALCICWSVVDAFADTKKNYLYYTEDPYHLEVYVYRHGEPKTVGVVDFPSRYSATRTAEHIMAKSSTKQELEYFCTWALAEDTEE